MSDSIRFKISTGSISKAIVAFGVVISVSACQTNEPETGPITGEFQGKSATAVLQNINSRALNCWIKSGDKEFEGFALVPELDTRSGTPRILIVEKGKAQGLPKMVIEASGSPVRLATYGPLAQSKLSGRINRDIIAWNTGQTGCNV